jgi:hypothetical protein
MLDFNTILNGVVTMGGVLGMSGSKMLEAGKCCYDVAGHGQIADVIVIIPFACDATVKSGFPVDGNGFIVATEKVEEVVGVFFANVLNCKVVDNETEHDWAEGVAPEARGVSDLVITMFEEAFGQELVG